MSKRFKVSKVILGSQKTTVKEVDVDNLPDPLPKPYQSRSFRMMIVGPSGSGKSNLFISLLTRAYKGIFTNVFIFCPTFYNDQTLNQLLNKDPKTGEQAIEEEDVIASADADEIATIIKKKLDEIDTEFGKVEDDEARPKTLMVFDDLTNELKDSTALKDLFTKGRKHEVSVIIMTNKYRVYNPQIRNNATHLVVFKPSTQREMDDIANDLGIDPKTAILIMKKVFSGRDNTFLFVDKTKPIENAYWVEFEQPIKIN